MIKFNPTHIKSGQEYIDGDEISLDDKELVLSPNQEYTLVIDYPLDIPAKFSLKSGKRGLTRAKLVSKIRNFYKRVYQIEDSTTKVKPGLLRGMLNRNFTDGKFGIWGHDLSDLVLVDATVSNKNIIRLGVDS